MKPVISVIIPALNEEKYIGRTLRSLLNQTLDRNEYELIVVDGNSKDRTVKIARKYADKVLVEKGGSIAYARNFGAKRARGDIVAFIDADTIAPRGWLHRIKEVLAQEKIYGMGGGAQPAGGSEAGFAYYRFETLSHKIITALGLCHFPGYNCAYRRKEFLSMGGFNPKSKVAEDVEFSSKFGRRYPCGFFSDIFVRTSYRRFNQQGALRVFFSWLLGVYYVLIRKELPLDYSGNVDKRKKID
jgi:glycosyltransferase involved in cell wall biosynthesis